MRITSKHPYSLDAFCCLKKALHKRPIVRFRLYVLPEKPEAYDDKAYQGLSGLGVGLMDTGHRELPGGDGNALLLGGGAGSSVPLSEPIVHLEWQVLPRIPQWGSFENTHTALYPRGERVVSACETPHASSPGHGSSPSWSVCKFLCFKKYLYHLYAGLHRIVWIGMVLKFYFYFFEVSRARIVLNCYFVTSLFSSTFCSMPVGCGSVRSGYIPSCIDHKRSVSLAITAVVWTLSGCRSRRVHVLPPSCVRPVFVLQSGCASVCSPTVYASPPRSTSSPTVNLRCKRFLLVHLVCGDVSSWFSLHVRDC